MATSEQNNAPAGWVDTHLHLLPGIDDGPATMELALAMAEVIIGDGVSHVVVTPHSNYQFTFDPAQVTALRDRMQAHLGERLTIMTGCELHLSFENVQAVLANPRLYSLNGGRYVLVEFPEYFERNSMQKALEGFCDIGLVPLIAHPERNQVFQQHPSVLDDYLRLGCIAQVTASSFSGRFGKRAQEYSNELLNRECIHVVASDGHSAEQRSPRLSKAHAAIEAAKGAELAQILCRDNPWAIACDRKLPYAPEPAAKRKSLWSRLKG
jgi:protein-tyrosine phosphatase